MRYTRRGGTGNRTAVILRGQRENEAVGMRACLRGVVVSRFNGCALFSKPRVDRAHFRRGRSRPARVNVRETTVSIGRLLAWTSLRGPHWSMVSEKPVKGCFLRLAATAPVGPFNSHDKAEITVPVKETTVKTGTVIVTRIK